MVTTRSASTDGFFFVDDRNYAIDVTQGLLGMPEQ